ncbi:DUF1080 domain-containing protein [Candidatus Poribacteria bacterium]|nr:DUF1080 domain-containing protein [Candidatus Poribacteria bacterium]
MEIKPGFKSMFNGKDLTGWTGNMDLWKVEDGILVGRTVENLDHNEFLRAEKTYSDFVMYCEVRLKGYNSGIQFRSKVLEDGHMAGYQADIGDNCWGALYEEMLRGHLVNYKPDLIDNILKHEEWNEYQIIASSDYIIQILNGVVTAELVDPDGASSGYIGLQIHSGPPQEVCFKNLCIKEL